MDSDKPWSRPKYSAYPNRPGDRRRTPIYTALGRAVSNWEGVSAATATLFLSLVETENGSSQNGNLVEGLGGVSKVHERAKQISSQADHFFNADFGARTDEARSLGNEIRSLMAAYRGWAERRNDLAHGYVTLAQGPDYAREEQPTITTYSLCPSHARLPKWHNSEPEFNYVAKEIADFASAFRSLDKQIEVTAKRVEDLRSRRTMSEHK